MGIHAITGLELPATVFAPSGDTYEYRYRATQEDIEKMSLALEMARLAMEQGDNPIGAVLRTPFGDFAAETREHIDNDSEAHAEKRVYRAAIEKARQLEAERPHRRTEPFGLHLNDCMLYSTAELCVGCSHLYDQVGIAQVFIAATRRDTPGFFRDKTINQRTIWQQSPRNLVVVEGLLREEAKALLTANTKKHE